MKYYTLCGDRMFPDKNGRWVFREDWIEFRRVLAEEIERHEKAAVKALDWIESADHKPGCPRIRDDYECTCGRDEVIQALYGVFEGAQ